MSHERRVRLTRIHDRSAMISKIVDLSWQSGAVRSPGQTQPKAGAASTSAPRAPLRSAGPPHARAATAAHFQLSARTPATAARGTTVAHEPITAAAVAIAHRIETRCSIMPTSFDWEWRRSTRPRRDGAWRQRLTSAAEAIAPAPNRSAQSPAQGEAKANAARGKREDEGDRLADRGDLGAFDDGPGDGSGREKIRRVLGRERDPGQGAGELRRDHDQGGRERDPDCACRSAAAPENDGERRRVGGLQSSCDMSQGSRQTTRRSLMRKAALTLAPKRDARLAEDPALAGAPEEATAARAKRSPKSRQASTKTPAPKAVQMRTARGSPAAARTGVHQEALHGVRACRQAAQKPRGSTRACARAAWRRPAPQAPPTRRPRSPRSGSRGAPGAARPSGKDPSPE